MSTSSGESRKRTTRIPKTTNKGKKENGRRTKRIAQEGHQKRSALEQGGGWAREMRPLRRRESVDERNEKESRFRIFDSHAPLSTTPPALHTLLPLEPLSSLTFVVISRKATSFETGEVSPMSIKTRPSSSFPRSGNAPRTVGRASVIVRQVPSRRYESSVRRAAR